MLRLCASGAPDSGRVTLVAWNDGALSIRAQRAAPPGSRLELTVDSVDPALPAPPFRLKVHRCRLQDDGSFLVEGRPLDLRRETREALDSLETLA